MTRGILTVAFGREYQELAVHTVAHNLKYTDLPFVVLANEPVSPKWEGLDDVTVHVFALDQKHNRDVKTQMCRYTPFEETLYLDCDAVIRRSGVDDIFELMGDRDIFLNKLLHWNKGDKIIRLYRNSMKLLKAELPLDVYNGGMICWRSNDKTERFFKVWNQYWKKIGRGREMPALACALQHSSLDIGFARSNIDHVFVPDIYDPSCLIQHNYNSSGKHDWHTEFKLPRMKKQWKPFDNDPKDWNWVEWNE